MTGVNPEYLPVFVLGGILGALFLGYPIGFFHAVWRRAWSDRAGARAGATKAHKAAVSLIPRGFRFLFGTAMAVVLAAVILLNTPEEPGAGTVPASVPSSTPTR